MARYFPIYRPARATVVGAPTTSALPRRGALLRIVLVGCLAAGALALVGCASNHPVTKSGEQCASCHSDGREAVEGAGTASTADTGLTFAVESNAEEVYLCTAAVAEDGTVVPARLRTLGPDERSSVTVSSPGLYALCAGDVAGPSAVVLVNAAEDGPADGVVKL